MAGEVRRLIDELIRLRSKGKPSLEPFVRVQRLRAHQRVGVERAHDGVEEGGLEVR